MGRYIIDLDRKQACKERYTGGKGASLARLRQNGLNTPPGFVITPRAFRAFLEAFSVVEIAQKKQWAQSELSLIQTWFRESPLPPHLHRTIALAYRAYGGPVAVRSSMIGEDSETASFAGQLDTVLNVVGQIALDSAVKQCWASLFNWRLITYLNQRELMSFTQVSDRFAMAVIVQRMVPARAAGVAFSADPLTGQRNVFIEAVQGLGDSLVSGRVDPDRYVVSTDDTSIEISLADPPHRALPTSEVPQLARLVSQLHNESGVPQDVEWAWDGQSFHLLQSRPITSLADKRIYSTSMVSEMLPGLIKPLVWSVSTQSKLQHVLGRIFTELIGPNDIDFTKLAKRIHSRVYADNTQLGEILGSMGLPPNFFEVMSRDENAAHRRKLPVNLRTLRTMVRIGRFILRYGRIAQATESYIERHTLELEPYRRSDWSSMQPQTLLRQAADLQTLYSESMWMNFIGPINMMLRNLLLGHCVRLWAPQVVASDLMRGLQGLKSLQSERELRRLSIQAAALGEDAVQCLATGDDTIIRTSLSRTVAGQTLLNAMDEFLEKFGFLSAVGTDLSRPPWIEHPAAIWQAIARCVLSAQQAGVEDVTSQREAAQQEAMSQMNWWQRHIFSRVLASTRIYIGLRERTSFLISEDSFQLRRVFLALANSLVEQGHLREPDDVFYLRLEEAKALVAGDMPPEQAQQYVDLRRGEMKADANLDLPDIIYGDYVPTTQIAPADDHEHLTGIVGSSGVVCGRACVILDPALAPAKLDSTDILIVPFTDVSWTPLLVGIGGIVAETGGQLSHSAIIARELGLPAVVNVKHATKRIRNGQSITLDGNQGRVYLQ